MSCGTESAARQWAPSYKRATVMQVTLALLAAILSRAVLGGGVIWYLAAALIFAVVPFTAIVVLPTNTQGLERDVIWRPLRPTPC